MIVDNVDFSNVIDRAVEVCGGNLMGHALRWFQGYRPIIKTWLRPPAAYDVHSLVYRHLVEYLSGFQPVPADNRALTYVIAAGNDWRELPGHYEFWPDESYEVFAMRDDFGRAYFPENIEDTSIWQAKATLSKWSETSELVE